MFQFPNEHKTVQMPAVVGFQAVVVSPAFTCCFGSIFVTFRNL